MSRHEWEEGTIVLPSGYMPKLRAALNAVAAQEAEKLYAAADVVRIRLLAVPAAKRRALGDQRLYFGVILNAAPTAPSRNDQYQGEAFWRIIRDGKVSKLTLAAARKHFVTRDKDYQTGKPVTVFHPTCEATITLDGNKVHWSVPENNHAVDHARESVLGTALFEFLERVTWTTRSGGELVGNDEYTQDDRSSGGGANYVTATYSKAEQKRKQDYDARLQASRSRMYW